MELLSVLESFLSYLHRIDVILEPFSRSRVGLSMTKASDLCFVRFGGRLTVQRRQNVGNRRIGTRRRETTQAGGSPGAPLVVGWKADHQGVDGCFPSFGSAGPADHQGVD